MNRPKPRTLIYAAIATVMLIVIVMAFVPDPIEVDTALVERGPMTVTIDEKGETRARERFTITAPVAGELRRIDLREGVAVSEGEVVAVIEPLPLDPRQRQEVSGRVEAASSALAEARSMVDRAEAAYSLAVSERQRAESLASDGIASAETLERAQAGERTARDELEAARSRVRSAAAELEVARAGLMAVDPGRGGRLIEVRSPAAGEVLSVPDRSGRVVQPGQPLLEISNARDVEVVIEMLSSEAVKVEAGDPVIIEDWGGDAPLRGTVRLVEPSGFTKISALGIEEQRVNVIVDPESVPAALGDGYRVETRVVIWQSDDVLKVPISTLFRVGSQWALFVVESDEAVVREVEIGHQTDVEAEILSGVTAGDVVVLHPSNDLDDGSRVEAR